MSGLPRLLLALLLLAGTAGTAGRLLAQADDSYVLRSEDRLQFRIAEDPATDRLPILVGVNSVGEASFPVSRESDIRLTVRVRGKTLNEVRGEVQRLLEGEYYHAATVTLTLDDKKLTPGKVIFTGEVVGTVALLPDEPAKMLSETVVALRPSDYADLRRVKLYRQGETEPRVINVRDLLNKNARDQDVELKDGDRVEVPAKWIN
jgi:protein involved in polysaccharide export with SLBB domain